MYIRPLYLACFSYRRAVTNGSPFDEWWNEPPEYFRTAAALARAAFTRRHLRRFEGLGRHRPAAVSAHGPWNGPTAAARGGPGRWPPR